MEKETPIISVIIPYYNVETDLLDRCIDSILNQTLNNYEIIIIDDGSDSGFANYLDEKICPLDNRISVYHQKNQGVSSARNLGITISKGKYITFIDSDDVILPYFFEEGILIAEKENADFVVGGTIITDEIRLNLERKEPVSYKTLSGSDVPRFKPHLLGNIYSFGKDGGYINRGVAAKIVKREIAVRHFYNTILDLGEDRLWFIEILENCKKICIAEQIWYEYYKNRNSSTKKFNSEAITENIKFYLLLVNKVNKENLEEYLAYIDMILEDMYLHVFMSSIGHTDRTMTHNERNQIIRRLYTEKPWTEIKSIRYLKNTKLKNKIKTMLYCLHLLIFWWDIKNYLKKIIILIAFS